MMVLVTGSRDYTDRDLVWSTLDELPISYLVEGGARGADTLSREYCQKHGIPVCTHNADWNAHGKSAGPIRNQEMLDHHPDILLCVAFPLPGSRGTWDMVDRAKKAGIHVQVVGQ